MRRLADAYPDPKTGENTAISSALRADFTQVYILPEPNYSWPGKPLQHAIPDPGPPLRRLPEEESGESLEPRRGASEPTACGPPP